MVAADLSRFIHPRIVIVSRRCVRKDKFVDFVGEYHLDLIVRYGAVPVIVPRVAGVDKLLQSFEPIHGVLLCEGEDIDPTLYGTEEEGDLSAEELEDIRRIHSSDTAIDSEKDSIEIALTKICLERNIPFLGICRGSQVLNVVCGGTLYQDVREELSRQGKEFVAHIDYDNYDDHRHGVTVMRRTPLDQWFKESLDEKMELQVNSYHHQGVKRLAERFVPMAFSKDGLIEGYYDPDAYDPEAGKFIIGLQFHPERMQQQSNKSQEFDYPGCAVVYQEFVKAVFAYQRKLQDDASSLKMEQELEEKGSCFSPKVSSLSSNEEKRLKQMGATVRNSSSYMERVKMDREREMVGGPPLLEKMSREQLTELLAFYGMMGRKICMELVERKIFST